MVSASDIDMARRSTRSRSRILKGVEQGVVKVEIDGREIEDHSIPLEDRSTKHNVRVQMGKVEDLAN